jgi:hypothetical protein
VLLAEEVVEHDHHQGDDQPERQVFVERVQRRLPPNGVAGKQTGLKSLSIPYLMNNFKYHLLRGGLLPESWHSDV